MSSRLARTLSLTVLGLLLAGLIGACGGAVPADVLAALPDHIEVSNSGSEMAFTGQIQALDSHSWTVEGVTFDVNGQTDIKGDFAVGDQVKVHLTLDASSGDLLATEIEPAPDQQLEPTKNDPIETETLEATESTDATPELEGTPGSEDFEFVGVVSAMDAGSWTINDKTVTISDQTEIKDVVVVGDTVKVEARVNLDGTITAKEISLASADDLKTSESTPTVDRSEAEIKIVGTVQAYGPDSITVNGQVIGLVPMTEIEGVLAVGADVKVEAYTASDGTLTAQSIEVSSNSAIETSPTADDGYEMDDSSESEDHHDGSSGTHSESDSKDSHDGGGQSDD